jgi:hypothetical protein
VEFGDDHHDGHPDHHLPRARSFLLLCCAVLFSIDRLNIIFMLFFTLLFITEWLKYNKYHQTVLSITGIYIHTGLLISVLFGRIYCKWLTWGPCGKTALPVGWMSPMCYIMSERHWKSCLSDSKQQGKHMLFFDFTILFSSNLICIFTIDCDKGFR